MAEEVRFEVGDVVRYKNPMLEHERGEFTVARVGTQIGRPCWLRDPAGNPVGGYPPPSDLLQLVRRSRESAEDRRYRELEARVAAIERHLGIRL